MQILSLHGADHGAVFFRLHTKPQGSSEKKLAVGWGSQTGCAKMILLTAGNIAHIYITRLLSMMHLQRPVWILPEVNGKQSARTMALEQLDVF